MAAVVSWEYICEHCECPAFRLTRLPVTGDRADIRDVRHLDGSPVKHGELSTCDSCGREIRAFDLERIRRMS